MTTLLDASIQRGRLNCQLAKLQVLAYRKRKHPQQTAQHVTTRELQSEALMCELSPPLLEPHERKQIPHDTLAAIAIERKVKEALYG
jgi:hypothetical protein